MQGLTSDSDLSIALRRRTKMWFINLTRPLLLQILAVIIGQVLAGCAGVVIKALTSDE